MSELIITPSGVRGVVGDTLTINNVLDLSSAFGKWVEGGKVIIGRDTRLSGPMIECAVTAGLLSQGCEVVNVGVLPTPVIIHAKNKLGIKAGIIISGSHNPPEWNALKLMSDVSFTSNGEINEVKGFLGSGGFVSGGEVVFHNPLSDYLSDLFNFVKVRGTGIRVVLDTGAGAGKFVTPKVLEKLGCDVTLINNDLVNGEFPRNPEPVAKNLSRLIDLMKSGDFDVGFAHDCDADRLTIVGNDGTMYQEDVGLALIAKFECERYDFFVTNSASSLMFEAIMGKDKVIRTPVGERYLAVKMKELLNKGLDVFGGEGSCGGVMFPEFNNCRDGVLAAAKIVEVLFKAKKSISELVSELPKFHSKRRILRDINISEFMSKLRSGLKDFMVIDNDVKVVGDDWFVLAHPSNTEPIIRVISEAKSEVKAVELVDWFVKLGGLS